MFHLVRTTPSVIIAVIFGYAGIRCVTLMTTPGDVSVGQRVACLLILVVLIFMLAVLQGMIIEVVNTPNKPRKKDSADGS